MTSGGIVREVNICRVCSSENLAKYLPKIRGSMQHIIRLLQLKLFARRDLADLLRGAPPDPESPNPQAQLLFA